MSTINRQRMLQRFLRYVKVHTTSVEGLDRYPSSDGQMVLGKMLVEELHQLGIDNALQDEHGIVIATLNSNSDKDVPVIGFNSHLDTSPETSGKDVKPNVIENYQGGEIVLSADSTKIITIEENPELADLVGCTLITTDGTTLLGGDDKAGIAIIMELVETLLENPEIRHGDIRILFTCDEEIGHGVDHVDVPELKATACYTFDGGASDMVDVETFSADLAEVTISGVNIHPSIGKDRMVNAMRAAGEFLAKMPRDISPEQTEGRNGFLHPYTIEGGVAEVVIKVLLRDFDTEKLRDHEAQLRAAAAHAEKEIPGSKISINVIKQYRNMADGLVKEPRAVEFAFKAHERLGRTARKTIIRGGTDGSAFTEKGLPTPNLSSGQYNQHSPLEWACLDEMVKACEVGIEITKLWEEEGNN